MAEYIDKKAAMSIPILPREHRYYFTLNLNDAFDRGWNAAMECVGLIPTADVRENVKGEWQHRHWFITCSVCNYTSADTDDEGDEIATNFCPNCGADMRGKK